MLVRDNGKTTPSKDEHPLNAFSFIVVRVAGNEIPFKDVHPSNAPCPIAVTGYPSTTEGTTSAPSAGVTAVIVALVIVLSEDTDRVYDQVEPSISFV